MSTPPEITALTATVPQLGQSDAVFDVNTNAWIPTLFPFQTQANAAAVWIGEHADDVAANTAIAVSAASDAVSAGGAVLHDPAASYAIGDAAISNIDLLTYRASSAVSGPGAPDPSADLGNWRLIGFSRDYADLTGKPTLGTAAALDTGTAEGEIPVVLAGGKLPVLDGSNLTNLTPGGVAQAVKISVTSGSSEIIIPIPTGLGMLFIEGRGITQAGNSRLYIRMSNNDGVSYKSSSSDYSSFGGNVAEAEVGVNPTNRHAFHATCLGGNDPAAVCTLSGNVFSGVSPVSGGSSFDSQTDIRMNTRFLGVTHIKVYVTGTTFTGGAIYVSRVLTAP